MKSWFILTQNTMLLYCSPLLIENLTFPRFSCHFLSDWPPNPNHKKEKMRRVSPYLISSFLCTLSQGYLFRLAAFFFPNNIEGSKRNTTRFGHRCFSKKKAKRKKRYNLMIERLLSGNTSNRFKFIVTPTRGKNLWSP